MCRVWRQCSAECLVSPANRRKEVAGTREKGGGGRDGKERGEREEYSTYTVSLPTLPPLLLLRMHCVCFDCALGVVDRWPNLSERGRHVEKNKTSYRIHFEQTTPPLAHTSLVQRVVNRLDSIRFERVTPTRHHTPTHTTHTTETTFDTHTRTILD